MVKKHVLFVVYVLQQARPEPAPGIGMFFLALIEYPWENSIQLTWIKEHAFAGCTEIKLRFLDDHGLEFPSSTARALAPAIVELQIEDGIESLGDSRGILAGVHQAI